MKLDRLFYVSIAVLFLLLMAIGFHNFVPQGHGFQGRIVDPNIFPIVLIHGLAIAGWYVLYLVQTLLIAARNRRLHMTLGWSVVVLAPLIAITGTVVAIRSVQVTPVPFVFWGMQYSQFLLIMLTEIVTFTGFVTAGFVTRKKLAVHRVMMLCASLSLLGGATSRIAIFYPIFGDVGFFALFRPLLAVAILLLLIRSIQTRSFHAVMVTSFAILFGTYTLAYALATTHSWDETAAAILRW